MKFAVVSMVAGAGILLAVAGWLWQRGGVTGPGAAAGALVTVAFGLAVGAKVLMKGKG